MKSLVFDSWAIMAFLGNEPSCKVIQKILLASRRGEVDVFLSEINLGEIIYTTLRRGYISDSNIEEFLAEIEGLPMTIVPTSKELVILAAQLKSRFSISYADCFAAALAIKSDSELVSGDPEFKKLGNLLKLKFLA